MTIHSSQTSGTSATANERTKNVVAMLFLILRQTLIG